MYNKHYKNKYLLYISVFGGYIAFTLHATITDNIKSIFKVHHSCYLCYNAWSLTSLYKVKTIETNRRPATTVGANC